MEYVEYSFAVITDAEDVLLVNRRVNGMFDDDTVPHWEFPGGQVKKGELSEAVAIRQTREKTSNYVQVSENIQLRYHDIVSKKTTSYWACERVSPTTPWRAEPLPHVTDVDKVAWIAISSLNNYLRTPPHRDVARYLGL